jgi:hypothetical protein
MRRTLQLAAVVTAPAVSERTLEVAFSCLTLVVAHRPARRALAPEPDPLEEAP